MKALTQSIETDQFEVRWRLLAEPRTSLYIDAFAKVQNEGKVDPRQTVVKVMRSINFEYWRKKKNKTQIYSTRTSYATE